MMHNNFEKIYIENKIKNHANTTLILEKLNFTEDIIFFDDILDLIKSINPVYHPKERSKSLVFSSIRGEILRKCPGTCGHICCNYFVINLYVGCPINCSYCILQSYLNQPFTIINVDIETIFTELDFILKNNQDKIFRIGTGELGDSLVYDYITNFSTKFISFFSNYSNSIFEFKTKTDNIDNILKIQSKGNIVVGFSVNPQIIIDKDENNSSSLSERIEAMKQLIEKGYKISLHFDPIVNIDNFDAEYKNVIEQIFCVLKPQNIAWISLGTFRYTPELKNMIEYNYPESNLLNDEFIENQDKKYRYFKPLRIKLYKKIISLLKGKSEKLLIYLCMESPNVWLHTLGVLPFEEKKMDLLFKNAINQNR